MPRRDREQYDHTPEEAPFAAPHVGWEVWWALRHEMIWPPHIRRTERAEIARRATLAVVERLKAWRVEKRGAGGE